jgi:hypothetical protein
MDAALADPSKRRADERLLEHYAALGGIPGARRCVSASR